MVHLHALTWGAPDSDRRALLLHGLTGSADTWWRLGEALAADGWSVTAVDLRGHGDSPTTNRYRLADYAADLPAEDTRPWDLVVGHSLGGAVATLAATRPGFTRALALLDPVLEVTPAEAGELLAGELAELAMSGEELARLRPLWHPRDIEIKVGAIARATRHMVEHTLSDNPDWNVVAEAKALPVPTLILSGDYAVYSMLPAETADAVVAANANVTFVVVPGAGHSPHRDRPGESLAALREWLP